MLHSKSTYTILSIATFCIFFARGIQYCYYDAPFRILVWDEDIMKPFLEQYFGIAWQDWTQNPDNETLIIAFAKKLGYLFFIASFTTILVAFKKEKLHYIIIYLYNILIFICLINLIGLYLLYFKDKSYRPTEFLEYALQWGTPFLLLFYRFFKDQVFEITLKLLCAAVFISHGLYAIGVFATPVTYISMTINGLGISENAAKHFLQIIGWLDIVFSTGIFLPKIFKISILYMIFWGFITAIARLYCNWYSEMWEFSLQQNFHEMLVRFPHFLIPMILWKAIRK